MSNILKGGKSDKKTINDIVKRHHGKINDELVSLFNHQLKMGIKIEKEHTRDENTAKEIAMDHLWEDPKYYTKLKKVETKESMGASSSGSFEAPIFSGRIMKKDIHKFHNSNLQEVLGGTSMGTYDVPFLGTTPKGRKNPLKISGPESIKNSRAVKDKNFPKWGGPGGIFIKIKDKCKKFPYCNQGDINAIEILKENINIIEKHTGIPKKEIQKMILKEIKQIFI
jgi:hypothetical protein